MRTRARALSFLGLAGIGLYAVVVGLIGWEPIERTAGSVDLYLIAAIMAVETISLSLRAFKWRIVLGPNRSAAGVFFLSKAGGNLSPARVGELSPLLLREYRNTQTAAWILADRALEVAVTLGLGAIGVAVLSVHIGGTRLALIAVGCALVAGLLVVLLKPWDNKRVRRVIKANPFLARTANTIASFAGALIKLRTRLPALALITVICKCLDLTVGIFLYLSMGYFVPYAVLAAAQCVHGLTSAVPVTPSYTGVPYATAAAFIHETAAVPPEALAFAVPLRMAATSTVFWVYFGIAFLKHRALLAQPLRSIFARFTNPSRSLALNQETTDEVG